MKQTKYKGYLAFDFDCVIASYKRPFKFDRLGKKVKEVIEVMRYYYDKGYYILIFTGRMYTPKMKKWLKKYNVPYHGFNVQSNLMDFVSKFKPYYNVIIEDKSVNVHFKNNKKTKKELIKEINKVLKWNE